MTWFQVIFDRKRQLLFGEKKIKSSQYLFSNYKKFKFPTKDLLKKLQFSFKKYVSSSKNYQKNTLSGEEKKSYIK